MREIESEEMKIGVKEIKGANRVDLIILFEKK